MGYPGDEPMIWIGSMISLDAGFGSTGLFGSGTQYLIL